MRLWETSWLSLRMSLSTDIQVTGIRPLTEIIRHNFLEKLISVSSRNDTTMTHAYREFFIKKLLKSQEHKLKETNTHYLEQEKTSSLSFEH